ncbi:hypothetical protein S40288_11682 [Stachybotrys chartarum IBT 40288]|nr:hypothetical protein S40288_11682 [Stachybotrys chartarum IBT 40288]
MAKHFEQDSITKIHARTWKRYWRSPAHLSCMERIRTSTILQHPVNGMSSDAPRIYPHRGRSQVFGVGNMRLEDVPKTSLSHFTMLLRVNDEDMRGHGPIYRWLREQERDFRMLDSSMLWSANPLIRATLNLGLRGLLGVPDCAKLCVAHHVPEPRIIRNILVLVTWEWTTHSETFRCWSTRPYFHDNIKAWLDCMDTALAIRIDLDLGEERPFGDAATDGGRGGVDYISPGCSISALLCWNLTTHETTQQVSPFNQSNAPRALRTICEER